MVTTMRESCRRTVRRTTMPEGRRGPPSAPRDGEPRAAERAADRGRGMEREAAGERARAGGGRSEPGGVSPGVVGGDGASLPRRRSSESSFSIPDRLVSHKVEKERIAVTRERDGENDRGGGETERDLARERSKEKGAALVERAVSSRACVAYGVWSAAITTEPLGNVVVGTLRERGPALLLHAHEQP